MVSRLALIAALAGAYPVAAYAQTTPSAPTSAAASKDQTAQSGADQPQTKDIVVTGRFEDTGAKSAMKMNVRVLDTPFSVASYSNSFVKSLDTTNVADLYNFMNGVKKAGNTGYDITLRGFKASGDDRNTILVDGLPGLTGRYGSPPIANIDHVEVVKGPMSVLYGQIQPGGFINLITKKPEQEFHFSADLRYNTFASKYDHAFSDAGVTGLFDLTGPIDSAGNLSVRVTGQIGDNDTFRDYGYNKEQFVAPSFTWKIGANTSFTGQLEYRNVKEHFDTGLVAPPNGNVYDINLVAPITTVYQQPDSYRSERGFSQSALLTHDFGAAWTLHASFRHVGYDSSQQEISQTGIITVQDAVHVQRRARELLTHRNYTYGDVNITGKVDTFGIDHKLLVGLNLGSDLVQENRTKFFNSSTRNATTGLCAAGGICLDIPLYDPAAFYDTFPDFNSIPATNPQLANQTRFLTNKFTRSHNYGIYVSDLATLTSWLKLSVGLRKFSETSDVSPDERNRPGVSFKRTDSRNFLPSAGILIEPSHHFTIYGSYAESFVPADPSAIDANGNPGTLHPITAKQYEAGVKFENLFDDRLNLTAAVYQIDQDGQVTQNPCEFGTCSYQTGKGRSRGFELEGDATPIKHLQMIFGYSHIDAKILSSPLLPFQVGAKLPNVAPNAANLWTRYDWNNGFGLGLGVTYTGDRAGLLPTSTSDLRTLDLPAYTVVDAGIYYTKKNYALNLKIGNLLDKRYYESAGATGRIQIAPGQPRYLTLSARVMF